MTATGNGEDRLVMLFGSDGLARLSALIRFAWLALLLALAVRPALAQQDPAFETAAEFAILIDSHSGKVFFEKNADTPMFPASMSKIMTMLMVFERLQDGRLSLDDEFLITEDAWRRGGAPSRSSTMYAELNSRVKLRDLIQGVIVQSANDACIAIAEGIAGSEEAFAQMMTDRAHELGLTHANFTNATGLPDPKHVITARELASLARYLIEVFPEYYRYYSQREFTWNDITQRNRNPLLGSYDGADGVKTGHTTESGYGLVGSALRNGRRLIMVVNGLKSSKDRSVESQKLLDWGFRQFKPIDLYAPGETIGSARVWGGDRSWVPLVTKETVQVLLSEEEQARATADLIYTGPLRAPVAQGSKVGFVRFRVGRDIVSQTPVYTGESVPATDSMWRRAFDSFAYMVFGG